MNISCGLLIIKDNKILLSHITLKKNWDIPKGMKEFDETYLDCCLREVKEETNLDFNKNKNEFIDLGLYDYTKEKQLYLFLYNCKQDLDLSKCVCTTFFEKDGYQYPEVDCFRFIDKKDIEKYTNPKLALILCKILNVKLSFNQREYIRGTFCYVLRHKLKINKDGKASPWMLIDDFIKMSIECNNVLSIFSKKEILDLIKLDEEGRYTIKNNLIKVNYGHSCEIIGNNFQNIKPPSILYHLTFSCFIDKIKKEGLTSQNRKFVFLTPSKEKAKSYSKKINNKNFIKTYGKQEPILLKINSSQAYNDGIKFFNISNNIICSKSIPFKYIEILDGSISNDDFLKIYNKFILKK